MWEEITERLQETFKKLRGHGTLTEKNISDSLREIRRTLLESDVNYRVAKELIDRVQKKAIGQNVINSITPGQQVIKIFYDEIVEVLGGTTKPINISGATPSVIMVVGLQGSGKTTFCAKLAVHLRKQGKLPGLVALDPYRPAAEDQLKTLGNEINVAVFGTNDLPVLEKANSGILEASKAGNNIAILDTAGRLHVDLELMQELVQRCSENRTEV